MNNRCSGTFWGDGLRERKGSVLNIDGTNVLFFFFFLRDELVPVLHSNVVMCITDTAEHRDWEFMLRF